MGKEEGKRWNSIRCCIPNIWGNLSVTHCPSGPRVLFLLAALPRVWGDMLAIKIRMSVFQQRALYSGRGFNSLSLFVVTWLSVTLHGQSCGAILWFSNYIMLMIAVRGGDVLKQLHDNTTVSHKISLDCFQLNFKLFKKAEYFLYAYIKLTLSFESDNKK